MLILISATVVSRVYSVPDLGTEHQELLHSHSLIYHKVIHPR